MELKGNQVAQWLAAHREVAVANSASVSAAELGKMAADAMDEADQQREIAKKYEDRYFDLVAALRALLNRDITYDGSNAVLPFESHDQAINHIAEARRLCGAELERADMLIDHPTRREG